MSLAMLVILKNEEEQTTNILTVRPGENLEFGRYVQAPHPHIKIKPINGNTHSITTYTFTGKAMVCNASGETIDEVLAATFKGVRNE